MAAEHTTASDTRFRISRAGVLNVWQYDEQVFVFADGRLLLRGANGAGKSKTMEMLLPFVIDGDKRRLTASGRHHTSLVWLMLDGYDGAGRTGYVWVEFRRALADGSTETTTCGVGLRATASAREATAWFFTSPRRVGIDLFLENGSGPLSRAALAAEVESDGRGHVFDSPNRYRAHVGELLFGLPADEYESLLRLLYWLRQPQVGEDIDPKRLAEQLVNALPVVDTDTLRAAGDTFDELQAFGEEIDRRERSAVALADFVGTYAAYARSVIAERGELALTAASELTAARRRVGRTEREHSHAVAELEKTMAARKGAQAAHGDALARIRTLETSPEASSRQHLMELGKRVATLAAAANHAHRLVASAKQRAEASAAQADTASARLYARTQQLHTATEAAACALAECGGTTDPAPSAALLSKQPGWRPPADPDTEGASIVAASQTHAGWARGCGVVAGALTAAVTIVSDARSEADRARDRADEAQRLADATDERAETARQALAAAEDHTRTGVCLPRAAERVAGGR